MYLSRSVSRCYYSMKCKKKKNENSSHAALSYSYAYIRQILCRCGDEKEFAYPSIIAWPRKIVRLMIYDLCGQVAKCVSIQSIFVIRVPTIYPTPLLSACWMACWGLCVFYQARIFRKCWLSNHNFINMRWNSAQMKIGPFVRRVRCECWHQHQQRQQRNKVLDTCEFVARCFVCVRVCAEL